MQYHPIDPSKPTTPKFNDVFNSISTGTLEQISTYFVHNHNDPDEVHAPRESILILEAIWVLEVAGLQVTSTSNLETWVAVHGHEVLEPYGLHVINVDENFLYTHINAYLECARKLTQSVGNQKILVGAKYTHPMTHLEYVVPLQIDNVAYVSMHDIPRRALAHVYHNIAAFSDPRERVSISSVVFNFSPLSFKLRHQDVDFGSLAWRVVHMLATKSNIKIDNMVLGFDLEWNNLDSETRFRQGMLVDAHFEDLTAGWVVYSGMLQVPPETRLSKFLLDHNYTVTKLNTRGNPQQHLKTRLRELFAVAHKPIFIAYGGINSDIYVLNHNDIFLPHYIDGHIILNAGKFISLFDLHHREFGENFSNHSASSDAVAMLRLLRKRGVGPEMVWNIYNALDSVKAHDSR